MPISHQDLGDILGITRETVTNSMKNLRQKKLISTKKLIIVSSLENLEKEAYS
jgi:CRP-like cAMP-binding protein